MTLERIEDEIFYVFTESVRRLKWSLLTTLIISSLMMINLYLEYSFSNRVIEDTISRNMSNETEYSLNLEHDSLSERYKNVNELNYRKDAVAKAQDAAIQHPNPDTEQKLLEAKSSLNDEIKTLKQKNKDNKVNGYDQAVEDASKDSKLQDLTNKYARDRFLFTFGQNTLKATKEPERTLPFLSGLSIPETDYLPVLCIIQAIVTCVLWLCSRAISGPLRLLINKDETVNFSDEQKKQHERMCQMLHLHLLFAGTQQPQNKDKIGKFAQIMTSLLASICTISCAAIDIIEIFYGEYKGYSFGPQGAIWIRIIIYACTIPGILFFTVKTIQDLKSADKLIYSET